MASVFSFLNVLLDFRLHAQFADCFLEEQSFLSGKVLLQIAFFSLSWSAKRIEMAWHSANNVQPNVTFLKG
jgi:hypothetical protein